MKPSATVLARAVERDHALLTAACVLAAAGLVAILIGWRGASRSIVVAEQVPYLISGGLLGLAFIFLGALAYYGHHQSATIRQARLHQFDIERRHRAVLASLDEFDRRRGDGVAPARRRPLRAPADPHRA